MLTSLLSLSQLFYIAAGLIGISGLIFFHELGHFLFCKLFNIATPSFSIGFGPEIIARMIGKTRFIIAAIPLGGYVEIAGMMSDTDPRKLIENGDQNGLFTQKPFYQKVFVLLGGIIFNLMFAYFIFIGVYFVGAPATALLYYDTATPIIKEVVKDSLAEKLGIQAGDRVSSINGIAIAEDESPFANITPSAIQYQTVVVVRNNEEIPITIESYTPGSPLGILFTTQSRPGLPLMEAVKKGISTTNRVINQTVQGLFHMFAKRDLSQAGGPIKIISMITQSASSGFAVYILFLAIISINLALFNLLPVPILDGGQLLICFIELVLRRQLPLKVREYIFIITWLFFLVLIVYLSLKDLGIVRFIADKLSA